MAHKIKENIAMIAKYIKEYIIKIKILLNIIFLREEWFCCKVKKYS